MYERIVLCETQSAKLCYSPLRVPHNLSVAVAKRASFDCFVLDVTRVMFRVLLFLSCLVMPIVECLRICYINSWI